MFAADGHYGAGCEFTNPCFCVPSRDLKEEKDSDEDLNLDEDSEKQKRINQQIHQACVHVELTFSDMKNKWASLWNRFCGPLPQLDLICHIAAGVHNAQL